MYVSSHHCKNVNLLGCSLSPPFPPSQFDAQVTLSEKVRLSYLKSDEMVTQEGLILIGSKNNENNRKTPYIGTNVSQLGILTFSG